MGLNFRNFRIGSKLGIGFGLVIVLLTFMGVMTLISNARVQRAEKQAIAECLQNAFLCEKVVDHLKWQENVVGQIVNNEKSTAGLDGHKCGLGTWYYGELQESSDGALKEILKNKQVMERKLQALMKESK